MGVKTKKLQCQAKIYCHPQGRGDRIKKREKMIANAIIAAIYQLHL